MGFCDEVKEDQMERSSVIAKYVEMAKDVSSIAWPRVPVPA